MLWVLRIAFYLQVLLGLGRFAGLVSNLRIWETHLTLGFLIVVLALIALRPRPGVAGDGVRAAGRFAPIAPLLLGLAMYWGAAGGLAVVLLHMLLGLAALGLIEAAAGRERRSLAGSRRPAEG